MPALIRAAGAERQTIDFFAQPTRGSDTRDSYVRAVCRFCEWCQTVPVALCELQPANVLAYFEHLQESLSAATVRVHASAVRQWLEYLASREVLQANPARDVKAPRRLDIEARTAVMGPELTRRFFASFEAARPGDSNPLLLLRDRALCSVVVCDSLRIGSVIRLAVRDFEENGGRAFLILRERGHRQSRVTCHHHSHLYIRDYIRAARLDPCSHAPLFQSAFPGRSSGSLSGKPLTPSGVGNMLRQRCADFGLPAPGFQLPGYTASAVAAFEPQEEEQAGLTATAAQRALVLVEESTPTALGSPD